MESPKTSSQSPERRAISPERSTTSTRAESPRREKSPTRTTRPKRASGSPSPPPRVRSPSPTSTTTTTTTSKPSEKYGSWTGRSKVDIRQNFTEDTEQEINDLIHFLMIGGYQCLAMAVYFDRDEVGLFGMAHFAKWCSTEVFQCVRLLMDYIVVRGGSVRLSKIEKPSQTEWKTPLEALELLLEIKENAYDKTLSLHKTAGEQKDGHLNDFLETVILRPLVACNRQLIVLVTNLKRAGPALGEYQFNKHLETYLQNVMSDPKLSYVLHGGTDYLNRYHPPPNTPIDFATILGQLVSQTPELVSKFSVTDLISLVGQVNIGNMIKPFKNYFY